VLAAVLDQTGRESFGLGAWDGVDDPSIVAFIAEHRTTS